MFNISKLIKILLKKKNFYIEFQHTVKLSNVLLLKYGRASHTVRCHFQFDEIQSDLSY